MRGWMTALVILLGLAACFCTRPKRVGKFRRDSGWAAVNQSRPPSPQPHDAAATPAGAAYIPMTVASVTPTQHSHAVVLVTQDRRRGLLIFVGPSEALSIELRLAKRAFARPLTHDLFDSALGELGAEVERVRVEKIEDNTFYATVVLLHDGRRAELDARSSDAIALALGNGAPIDVAAQVLEEAGVDVSSLNPAPVVDAGLVPDSPERPSVEL